MCGFDPLKAEEAGEPFMEVEHRTHLGHGHSVELGRATWNLETSRSIRNRYETSNGGFSPRSSSEIPIGDLVPMVKFAAQHDELSPAQCADIIQALAASIERQLIGHARDEG
jgi:butyrate kinase